MLNVLIRSNIWNSIRYGNGRRNNTYPLSFNIYGNRTACCTRCKSDIFYSDINYVGGNKYKTKAD